MKKKEKREERQPKRELLKMAKAIYCAEYGHTTILYRNRLNDIKKALEREEMEKRNAQESMSN